MPSAYATKEQKRAYAEQYRSRNRLKLRAYKREWQRAYRAAGRDKSRAGKAGQGEPVR